MSNISDPVNGLRDLDISYNEVFHIDKNAGQVEVQKVSLDYQLGCSPDERMIQVIEQALWPQFFDLANTQSDEWLVNVAQLMIDQVSCPTYCLLELIEIAKSVNAKSEIFQTLYSTNVDPIWGALERGYLPHLMQVFTQLLLGQRGGEQTPKAYLYRHIVKKLQAV